MNQCLEAFLRCTIHSCPKQWAKWLPLAEFWYNTSYHSALKLTPFEVLYGHPPKHFGINNLAACSVPELEAWLKERDLLTKLLLQQLLRAQQRMKYQVDKNRTEREFSVGDSVYLKLQPYVQSSVTQRSNQNLSFKFFGPFPVLQRVGKVAYKLQLPEGFRIHPVVHVSQLKRFVPPHIQVSTDMTTVSTASSDDLLPVVVIDQKCIFSGASLKTKLLIQWSGLPEAWTTWEELHDVHQRFPDAPAWGQAGFSVGGSVMTQSG